MLLVLVSELKDTSELGVTLTEVSFITIFGNMTLLQIPGPKKPISEDAPRYGAVGFSIGSKGFIGTGVDFFGNYYNDFWEYNPATNTWTQKANFGGISRMMLLVLASVVKVISEPEKSDHL